MRPRPLPTPPPPPLTPLFSHLPTGGPPARAQASLVLPLGACAQHTSLSSRALSPLSHLTKPCPSRLPHEAPLNSSAHTGHPLTARSCRRGPTRLGRWAATPAQLSGRPPVRFSLPGWTAGFWKSATVPSQDFLRVPTRWAQSREARQRPRTTERRARKDEGPARPFGCLDAPATGFWRRRLAWREPGPLGLQAGASTAPVPLRPPWIYF